MPVSCPQAARTGLYVLVLSLYPIVSQAQFGAGFGPPLRVEPPEREFSSSDEHYAWLLERANGGTTHTLDAVPRWDDLWDTAGNTHMDVFVDGGPAGGAVRSGVLTPQYETAYRERWRQQQEEGQVRYDRLTHCEPAGMPRWLLEPYSHEFVTCRTSPT